jgi:D-lactate dehydrogenase (cytochrome)
MEPKESDTLIFPLQDRHADYLTDESRMSGNAESISFPQNEAQIQAIVKTLSKQQTPITVQGSRTGITGGAVPPLGHIMNLSKMTRVTGMEMNQDGRFYIRVQPGILLSELDHQLDSQRFNTQSWDRESLEALIAFKRAGSLFWPPDPSEPSASVGGIAASNSHGICALHYGPARDHIQQIRVVDAKGEILSIPKGEYLFSNGVCPLPSGGTLQIDPTALDLQPTMDLLDLFLGSQGEFGAITELTLSLQPLPKELWGIVFFFDTLSGAVDFINVVHQRQTAQSATHIVAIEFLDETTLESIREFKQENTRLKKLPDWESCLVSAVYIEIHGSDSGAIETLAEWLLETAGKSNCDPDTTWAACGKEQIEQLRLFRRAAPEAINHLIDKARVLDSRITKLGTDMRLKTAVLSELMDMYVKDLKAGGLKGAIFGHAADGHLHVNILPQDYPQFEQGKKLITAWAEKISAQGGEVVTEHGVGKIKKDLFRSIPLPLYLKMIGCIKQQLDPEGMWNPGNLIDFTK